MLQISSIVGDIEANMQKVLCFLDSQLPENVDILVLPEVWTVGWACEKFIESAQSFPESKVISFLADIAKKYSINVIGGSFITEKGGNYYNTCPVFDRNGNLICQYAKMHLYSYYGCDEGKYITKGDCLKLVEIEGVKYGLSICYDIRFPEVYREYAKSGADVLVNCAAWGATKSIPWEMMTKSRAIENQCYMIALTQSGKIKDSDYNLGHSRLIDFKGDEICAIFEGEGIITGTINLSLLYNFRRKAPILNDIRENYEVETYV